MSTLDHDFSGLFEALWEDEEIQFEAKAQDVAIALASAVHQAGLSRAELAKKLKWKPSRVTKVLTGSTNLTLKTIFEVCRAIGLEFDVVLRKPCEQVDVVDLEKQRSIHQEAVSNLERSRQLLDAVNELHRKVSQRALATRHYTREECHLKLVA
ncbi:helix-turn-helix transcriptional regulator [Halopseudomonas sp. Lyrl_26]|uniref:helix-turn-helix domain-containing protein n=1 Tax=Halopseudomonas sp. Lyrl_26 TaxID=3110923 RepID=UPI003F7FC7E7